MNSRLKDVLVLDWQKTVVFGVLSVLLSHVNFYNPLDVGIVSNLVEIPLFIGVIHIGNPIYVILLAGLAAFLTPTTGFHFFTFITHAIPLLIMWYTCKSMRKWELAVPVWALLGCFGVLIYYYLLLFPSQLVVDHFLKKRPLRDFWLNYLESCDATIFEVISTMLVVSLYATQDKLRQKLKEHLEELESTVERRTAFLNQALEDLKITQQHLVQSEKMGSISILTAGVAHEINNPLNIMAGGLKIMEQIRESPESHDEQPTSEEFEHALQMVEYGLKRCEELVQALISFSSEVKGAVQKYDIHKIIDITLRFMEPKTSSVIIIKDFYLDNLVPIYPDKMHQVLVNIFNNAFYAMENGLVQQRVLTVSTYESRGYGMIQVHNTGPKITEADLGRVFDPFFTTKDPDQGKGLGLSIAYSLIVKEHSGKIEVQNDETGVSFTISIPL